MCSIVTYALIDTRTHRPSLNRNIGISIWSVHPNNVIDHITNVYDILTDKTKHWSTRHQLHQLNSTPALTACNFHNQSCNNMADSWKPKQTDKKMNQTNTTHALAYKYATKFITKNSIYIIVYNDDADIIKQ